MSMSAVADQAGVDATMACCDCIPAGDELYLELGCTPHAPADQWRDDGGHTCDDYVEK